MSDYVSFTTLSQHIEVCKATPIQWTKQGRLRCIQLPGNGKRLYDRQQAYQLVGLGTDEEEEKISRVRLCYARVSSDKQKEDLTRQIADLQAWCPEEEVIHDIGSGLNYKRRGFTTLLERVLAGHIEQVTVTHRDRLCRYGIELVEFLFQHGQTRLVVLQSTESPCPISREQELAEDLLAIVNVFVARNNGLRAGANRRKRKREADAEGGQDSSVSNEGSAADFGTMVRRV